jgi:GNAT superfamily N-acetyltransferase
MEMLRTPISSSPLIEPRGHQAALSSSLDREKLSVCRWNRPQFESSAERSASPRVTLNADPEGITRTMKHAEITIRPGSLEDITREAELNQSVDWCYDERNTLAEYHDDAYEPSSVIVAELEGEIVGKLELFIARKSTHGHFGLIRRFVIKDGWRGSGIGRQMLDAAVEHATIAGCSFIELTVDVTNPEAHALYKRYGFDEDRVEVIMRKSLDGQEHVSDFAAQRDPKALRTDQTS